MTITTAQAYVERLLHPGNPNVRRVDMRNLAQVVDLYRRSEVFHPLFAGVDPSREVCREIDRKT